MYVCIRIYLYVCKHKLIQSFMTEKETQYKFKK